MNKPSAAQQETARRLLGRAAEEGSSQERAVAAERAYEKICLQLAPLIGARGVHALLARSMDLAKAEFPCLAGGPSGQTGSQAELLRERLQQQHAAGVTEATVALFATFIALLATFIGDRLAARALQGAFPDGGGPPPSERNI